MTRSPPAVAPVQEPASVPGERPILVEMHDVHLSFGPVEVLKGIDLTVARGDAVSIIGPSGSGKSTILRCINGLARPQSGQITVGGSL